MIFSTASGATYSPMHSLKMFLMRSVILNLPYWSSVPTSPVRNQPFSNPSLLASGFNRYFLLIQPPEIKISPFQTLTPFSTLESILSEVQLSSGWSLSLYRQHQWGYPTWPAVFSSGQVPLHPPAVSVRPQHSQIFTFSTAFKYISTSDLIGAEPVRMNFTLPPSWFLIFLNIALPKIPCRT